MYYYLTYMAVISLISVIITVYDKKASKSGKRRIRESTLLIFGILGGAYAMLAVMKLIRHKTKHKKFMIGLPLIIVIRIIATLLIIKYCYPIMLL